MNSYKITKNESKLIFGLFGLEIPFCIKIVVLRIRICILLNEKQSLKMSNWPKNLLIMTNKNEMLHCRYTSNQLWCKKRRRTLSIFVPLIFFRHCSSDRLMLLSRGFALTLKNVWMSYVAIKERCGVRSQVTTLHCLFCSEIYVYLWKTLHDLATHTKHGC